MGGPDGLYCAGHHVDPNIFEITSRQISTKPCNTVVGVTRTGCVAASWNGSSLYVADSNGEIDDDPFKEPERIGGFQWAAGGRVENTLALYSYNNDWARTLWQTSRTTFYDLGGRSLNLMTSDTPVSAQASDYGTVFDFGSYVQVLLNTGVVLKFEGEATVKVHPGQLHLIYEDYMDIVFFPSRDLHPKTLGWGTLPYLQPRDKELLGL